MKRLLVLACLFFSADKLYALPFVEGRAGGGYAYVQGKDGSKPTSTGVVTAAGRYGYQFDNSNYFLAVDVTAFRVFGASSLKTNNDGNTALLVFGHNWEVLTLWLAGGAGEIRTRDRTEDKSRPYRYYATDAKLGGSIDFYRSESARLDFGVVLGRISPDPEWRSKYNLESINTLEFEIGFKLLNW